MTTFLHKVARETTRTRIAVAKPKQANEILVDLVLAATASADWSQPGFQGRLDRCRSTRGEVLLATLTYCYALGMYSSSHIEFEIYRNRNNAQLVAQVNLDRRSLARFRKYNRDLIKVCLMQVLAQMVPFSTVRTEDLAQEAEDRIEHAAACDFLDFED